MFATAILKSEPDMQVVSQTANGQQAVDLFCQLQPEITLIGRWCDP